MSATLVEHDGLDPWNVRLTKHVIDRYMERRGWPASARNRADAELAIRNLLARCANKKAPIHIRPGRTAVRRYRSGGMCWIVTADNSTVITFWPEVR